MDLGRLAATEQRLYTSHSVLARVWAMDNSLCIVAGSDHARNQKMHNRGPVAIGILTTFKSGRTAIFIVRYIQVSLGT
eukprot:2326394-Amphidinium_carterae.1